jgi:CRISPR-associated protein Cst1
MKSDGGTLRLTLADWQWNASVIGFINIVGKGNVRFDNDAIEVSSELLQGFEEKYFAYFIKVYEKTLSWYKIVAFTDQIESYRNDEFDSFNLQSLKRLNNYIKDVKRYLKSNSYKSAYDLIALDVDMLSLEKQLSTVKEPKSEENYKADKTRIIAEVKERFAVLEQIINYCKSLEGKRYIAAKNVIYTIIKNGWSGVSILNPQTKEKDMYLDYKKYFVDGAIEYLNQDKSKFKYSCFICDGPIKDMEHDLSFLNATGFDVARKSSHVWDFQNDIAICPLCKLIYSCLPAGFTYVYDRGVYINANLSVQSAYNINNNIRHTILYSKEGSIRSLYPALVGALQKQESDSAKYELADIQVVRYENESYRFNILSRKMLKIIYDSKERLESLIRAVLVENDENIRIYDEVVNRIFNNQNLFTLIHRLLYHKLANPEKCYFHLGHIIHLLRINQEIYLSLGGKKVGNMDSSKGKYLVREAREAGRNLKNRYTAKEANHKLPGICYRLLNALKISNQEMFMDVALNCYLYVKSPVPEVITNSLNREKDFSTMGYTFVAALIDEDKSDSVVSQSEEEKTV